jgi:hypothetical protein
VLGRLFTAARAALFLESALGGHPALAVTAAAVAAALDEREPASLPSEALGAYGRSRLDGVSPPERTVSAFRELVRNLAPYRSADRVFVRPERCRATTVSRIAS